jgi:sulfate adenylyltransferase subunit 1
MELIKIVTAGSVDDGKSTLIGRLLYETNSLKEDQLAHIENKSKSKGYDYLDFSLATDGLLTEREQGITIDVSNIFFSTDVRRFIVADSPGHVEYTRNMITGASTASAAIVLLDARKGVIEQTKRHFYITQLLGIKHVVFAVNKMDLVDYDQATFNAIVTDLKALLETQANDNLNSYFIPLSALKGDNVIESSKEVSWYEGPTFLSLLESIPVEEEFNKEEKSFQVQYVIRPKTEEFHDYRGFAGKVKSGSFSVGDSIKVHPSNRVSTIKRLEKFGEAVDRLDENENGTILLEDEVDVSRGSSILAESFEIDNSKQLKATVSWLQDKPLNASGIYWLQQGVQKVKAKIKAVHNAIDLETLTIEDHHQLGLNDIGEVTIQTATPIASKAYQSNKALGSFILIDTQTNNTAGVGFIN